LSYRVSYDAPWRPIATVLLPPVAAPAGMPRQELDDEASRRLPCWPS
jgi:hypothetical protein